MLTAATLGIFAFGAYSVVWAIVDIATGRSLEWWAETGLMLFGLLLSLSAAFVRVRLPGGVALAAGGFLGLQALAVHNAVHLDHGIPFQVAQGVLAVALIGLAIAGARGEDLRRG